MRFTRSVAIALCGLLASAGCGSTGPGASPTAGTSPTTVVTTPASAAFLTDRAPTLSEGRDFSTIAVLPGSGPGLESIRYVGLTTNHLAYGVATDAKTMDPYGDKAGHVILADLRTRRTSFIYHSGVRGEIFDVAASPEWFVWAEMIAPTVQPNPGAQPRLALYSFQRSTGQVRRILAAPTSDTGTWPTFDRGGELGIVGGEVYFEAFVGDHDGIFALDVRGSSTPTEVIKDGVAPSFSGNRIQYLKEDKFFTSTLPQTKPIPIAVKSPSGYAFGKNIFGYGHKTSAGFGLTFLDDSGHSNEGGLLKDWPAYMTIGNHVATFGQEKHLANDQTRTAYFAIDFVHGKVFRIPGSLSETPIVTANDEMIIHRQGSQGATATNEIVDLDLNAR